MISFLKSLLYRLTTPVVCAWCHATLRPAPLAFLARNPRASHGICQPCLATVKAELAKSERRIR